MEGLKSHEDQRIQTPNGELSGPALCHGSWPQVGRLKGLKPVVGDHQTGFSPDDRNITESMIL